VRARNKPEAGGTCLKHFPKSDFLFARHGSKRSGVSKPLQLAGLYPEPLRSILLCSRLVAAIPTIVPPPTVANTEYVRASIAWLLPACLQQARRATSLFALWRQVQFTQERIQAI
jgi:hypothetical protein